MEIGRVRELLLSTLSTTDLNARANAEREVLALAEVPGISRHLLDIARNGSDDASVRMLAVTLLKNQVTDSFKSGNRKRLPEEDLLYVRPNILYAVAEMDSSVLRNQLAVCVRTLASEYYPDQYPELRQAIVELLSREDPKMIFAGLTLLHVTAKAMEFRSMEYRQPVEELLQLTLSTVFSIAEKLFALPQQDQNTTQMVVLVLKILWCFSQFTIPAYLCQPENTRKWIMIILHVLKSPIGQVDPEDEDPVKTDPRWKAKKWCMYTVTKLLTRYGRKKHLARSIEEEGAHLGSFSDDLISNYMGEILQVCMSWALASRVAGSEYSFPSKRFLSQTVTFVRLAFSHSALYPAVQSQVPALLEHVIVPALQFTKAELEMLDDDPQDYLRHMLVELDGKLSLFEDVYTPRSAALALLEELCSKADKSAANVRKTKKEKKQEGNSALHVYIRYCQDSLNQYSANPTPENALRKDGALVGIGTLHEIIAAVPMYAASLEKMITDHVIPCIPAASCPYLHLRHRCLWLCGRLCPSLKVEDGAFFNNLLQCVVGALQDTNMVIRVESARLIAFLLEGQEAVAEALRPNLGSLVQAYFALINEFESDELLGSFERIMETYSEDIGPYAADIVDFLIKTFDRYTAAGGEDDDEAEFAAVQCLRNLNAVLISASKVPALFEKINSLMGEFLIPLIVNEKYTCFFEDTLIVGIAWTFYAPAITNEMWKLLPAMFKAFIDFAFDYVGTMATVMENLICRDPKTFMHGIHVPISELFPEPGTIPSGMSPTTTMSAIDMFNEMVRRTLGDSDCDEYDSAPMAALLCSVLQHTSAEMFPLVRKEQLRVSGCTDDAQLNAQLAAEGCGNIPRSYDDPLRAHIPLYLQLCVVRLQQQSQHKRFGQMMLSTFASIIFFDMQTTLDHLGANKLGELLMAWLPLTKELKRMADCKIQALALCKVAAAMPTNNPAVVELCRNVCYAIVHLLHTMAALRRQQENEDEDDGDYDDDVDDDYLDDDYDDDDDDFGKLDESKLTKLVSDAAAASGAAQLGDDASADDENDYLFDMALAEMSGDYGDGGIGSSTSVLDSVDEQQRGREVLASLQAIWTEGVPEATAAQWTELQSTASAKQ